LISTVKNREREPDSWGKGRPMLTKHALRKLFEFLVEQEKYHKLKLETEYEKHILAED